MGQYPIETASILCLDTRLLKFIREYPTVSLFVMEMLLPDLLLRQIRI